MEHLLIDCQMQHSANAHVDRHVDYQMQHSANAQVHKGTKTKYGVVACL
jgi:hypothetical protein